MATWFHFRGDNEPVEREIRAELSAVGIAVSCTDPRTFDEHGILCFSQFDDGLLQLLRDTRWRSRGQVLVLATSSGALPKGAIWQLLHAGASDVLVWTRGSTIAKQILAKLERCP